MTVDNSVSISGVTIDSCYVHGAGTGADGFACNASGTYVCTTTITRTQIDSCGDDGITMHSTGSLKPVLYVNNCNVAGCAHNIHNINNSHSVFSNDTITGATSISLIFDTHASAYIDSCIVDTVTGSHLSAATDGRIDILNTQFLRPSVAAGGPSAGCSLFVYKCLFRRCNSSSIAISVSGDNTYCRILNSRFVSSGGPYISNNNLTFFAGGNIHDSCVAGSYTILKNDTAKIKIQNCFIDTSLQREIYSDLIPSMVLNTAGDSMAYGGMFSTDFVYTNTKSCISAKADAFTGGNGCYADVKFDTIYESRLPSNSRYGIPIKGHVAYRGGVPIVIPGLTKYYNGVKITGTPHIGAMGVSPGPLSYPTTHQIDTVGKAAIHVLTFGGDSADSYITIPTLGNGLSINSTTGEISGTPTGTQAKTAYLIIGTNGAGSDTVKDSITIVEAPAACDAPAWHDTTFAPCTVGVTFSFTGLCDSCDSAKILGVAPDYIAFNKTTFEFSDSLADIQRDSIPTIAYHCEGDSTDTGYVIINVILDSIKQDSVTWNGVKMDGDTVYANDTLINHGWFGNRTKDSLKINDTAVTIVVSTNMQIKYVPGSNIPIGWFTPRVEDQYSADSSDSIYFGGPYDTASITLQPHDTTVTAGQMVIMHGTATSTGTITYKWQVDDGGGYDDIAESNNDTLTPWAALLAENGYLYRMIATDPRGADTSAAAELTVSAVVRTLTISHTGNGSTDPTGAQAVVDGDSVLVTYTAAANNHIISLAVGGSATLRDTASSAVYVVVSGGNGTASFGFGLDTFNITTSGDAHVTVSRLNGHAQQYYHNETVQIGVTPASGYAAKVNGGSSIYAACTLSWSATVDSLSTGVSYPLIPIDTVIIGRGTWTITASQGLYGDTGSQVIYSASPSVGWSFSEFKGTFSGSSAIDSFAITEAHSDTAVFTRLPATISNIFNVWRGKFRDWKRFR